MRFKTEGKVGSQVTHPVPCEALAIPSKKHKHTHKREQESGRWRIHWRPRRPDACHACSGICSPPKPSLTSPSDTVARKNKNTHTHTRLFLSLCLSLTWKPPLMMMESTNATMSTPEVMTAARFRILLHTLRFRAPRQPSLPMRHGQHSTPQNYIELKGVGDGGLNTIVRVGSVNRSI